MQKENFINFVSERLQDITGCEVKVNPVNKNNGVVLTGLVIMRGDRNIHPTIYLDSYYEDYQAGRNIESIVKEILRTEEKYQSEVDFDITCFTDFNRVKDNVYYKIINYESNSERLKDIPHKPILDVAKVYYFEIENEIIGNGTILITNEHMERWGVTMEALDTIARRNTEIKLLPSVKEMSEVLNIKLTEMYEDMKENGEVPEDATMPDLSNIRYPDMYVVSNKRGFYGAATLVYTNLLRIISETIEDDLVIFPSSIHECIIMPAHTVNRDYKELKEIVESINATVLSKEEFLSNNIYLYDRINDKLQIAE